MRTRPTGSRWQVTLGYADANDAAEAALIDGEALADAKRSDDTAQPAQAGRCQEASASGQRGGTDCKPRCEGQRRLRASMALMLTEPLRTRKRIGMLQNAEDALASASRLRSAKRLLLQATVGGMQATSAARQRSRADTAGSEEGNRRPGTNGGGRHSAEAGLADRLAREFSECQGGNRARDNKVPCLPQWRKRDIPLALIRTVMVTRNAAGMVTVDVNGDTDDVYAGGETTAGERRLEQCHDDEDRLAPRPPTPWCSTRTSRRLRTKRSIRDTRWQCATIFLTIRIC